MLRRGTVVVVAMSDAGVNGAPTARQSAAGRERAAAERAGGERAHRLPDTGPVTGT